LENCQAFEPSIPTLLDADGSTIAQSSSAKAAFLNNFFYTCFNHTSHLQVVLVGDSSYTVNLAHYISYTSGRLVIQARPFLSLTESWGQAMAQLQLPVNKRN